MRTKYRKEYKRRRIKKPVKYKIYYKKTVWTPLKFKSYGWKKTKMRIAWLKKKGIKAYARRVGKNVKKNYIRT